MHVLQPVDPWGKNPKNKQKKQKHESDTQLSVKLPDFTFKFLYAFNLDPRWMDGFCCLLKEPNRTFLLLPVSTQSYANHLPPLGQIHIYHTDLAVLHVLSGCTSKNVKLLFEQLLAFYKCDFLHRRTDIHDKKKYP